jgi:molybdopterin-guanine dinucleotide biosynthesis protein A
MCQKLLAITLTLSIAILDSILFIFYAGVPALEAGHHQLRDIGMPKYPISGVIIADHRGRQTDGAAFVRTGHPAPSDALSRVSTAFESMFDEVILVTADPAAVLDREGLIVADHYAPAGLLSGIHAGLFAARHSRVLVTAPDLPMVTPAIIDLLLREAAPQDDALLPSGESGLQPLPAVYAKTCLKILSRQLACGRPSVRRCLHQFRVRTVAESDLRKCDPQWHPVFRLTADESE